MSRRVHLLLSKKLFYVKNVNYYDIINKKYNISYELKKIGDIK